MEMAKSLLLQLSQVRKNNSGTHFLLKLSTMPQAIYSLDIESETRNVKNLETWRNISGSYIYTYIS